MSDVILWVMLTIGVVIALMVGALIVYFNEKKFREELVEYYETLIEKQDDAIKTYRQKVQHLETKIDFYERNKEEC